MTGELWVFLRPLGPPIGRHECECLLMGATVRPGLVLLYLLSDSKRRKHTLSGTIPSAQSHEVRRRIFLF